MTGSDVPVAVHGNRWSRLSDWLNPIVVREVQQALRGRAFMLAVFAALIFVVGIALFVAGDFDPMRSGRSGRHAFNAGLATLVPLLLFVTPMGAYQSMRHELRGGMVEQLLLSELRPRRIIFGKLTAAMVQFVLYVSVIAPLLAASYLLQGVDLPTVAVSLLFALVFCVTATAFAISSAAQGMLPALQGFANLAVALGLGMATMLLVGFVASGEYIRDMGWLLGSSELSAVVSLTVLGGVLSCLLSGLTAASFLAHAHENKSSGFRVFLFLILVVGVVWVALFLDPADRGMANLIGSMTLLVGGAVFAIFMVTEQEKLSPRVAAHVPRSTTLALLSAPFLPGRHRGMLCFLLFAAAVACVLWFGWSTHMRYGPSPEDVQRLWLFLLAYCVIYLTLGKALRSRLPRTVQGNYLARAAVPLALIAFCLLPVLFDVLVQGRVNDWHFLHVLDPFWTIDEHARGRDFPVLGFLLAISGALIAVQIPGMLAGVGEVLYASRRRRWHERERRKEAEAEGAA